MAAELPYLRLLLSFGKLSFFQNRVEFFSVVLFSGLSEGNIFNCPFFCPQTSESRHFPRALAEVELQTTGANLGFRLSESGGAFFNTCKREFSPFSDRWKCCPKVSLNRCPLTLTDICKYNQCLASDGQVNR